jgi:ribosomal protein L7/L12
MSTTTMIIIVAIAVVVFLLLRFRSESGPSNPLADFQAQQSGTAGKPDVRHIVQLLLEGKKIEAIKAYMELAGVGLEEAKSTVERYDPIVKKLDVLSPPSFDSITDWSEIDGLLEQGDKIGAIKLYRQKTGCDLKEAKDAIDIRDNPS